MRSDATENTFLFGAGGFFKTQLSFETVDLLSSSDVLIGSGNGNVLSAGSGVPAVGRNILQGGAGQDYLIGDITSPVQPVDPTSPSTMIGGAGTNVYVSKTASDYLIGGEGGALDIANYSRSGAGISINLLVKTSIALVDAAGNSRTVSAATGLGGFAENDRLFGIDTFVGSAHNDVFRGDGNRQSFFGGDGADSFYMKAGTTAIGGAGADKFYIESATPFSEMGIIGLEAEDEIYIDGQLYTGRTREMVLQAIPQSDGESLGIVSSDQSAFGTAYRSPHNPIGLQTSDVYRQDYMILTGPSESDSRGALLVFEDQQAGTRAQVYILGYESGDGGMVFDLDTADYSNGAANTTILTLHPGDINPYFEFSYRQGVTDFTWLGGYLYEPY